MGLNFNPESVLTTIEPMLGMSDEETFVAAVLTVASLLALWVVVSNLRRYLQVRSKEITRREVAAYVAEGSIKPEDARMLLGNGSSSEAEEKIADAVSWGMLKAEKAEALIRALRDECAGKTDAKPTESA